MTRQPTAGSAARTHLQLALFSRSLLPVRLELTLPLFELSLDRLIHGGWSECGQRRTEWSNACSKLRHRIALTDVHFSQTQSNAMPGRENALTSEAVVRNEFASTDS